MRFLSPRLALFEQTIESLDERYRVFGKSLRVEVGYGLLHYGIRFENNLQQHLDPDHAAHAVALGHILAVHLEIIHVAGAPQVHGLGVGSGSDVVDVGGYVLTLIHGAEENGILVGLGVLAPHAG